MAASITLFANQTAPTGPELDNNFLAYAVFGGIPCVVSGTNALTLVQNANTPTLTQLTNYIVFTGVFTNVNSGALTLQVAGFPALNGYKDSTGGPTAFTGGECVVSNAFSARYDSALNSGAGGFHVSTATGFVGGTIANNLVVSGAALSVIGGSIGASLTSSLLTGNSLTISALLDNPTKLVIGTSAASVTRIQSALGTLSYSITPANGTQDQTFALAGAQVNDSVSIGLPASIPAGAGFTGYMAAAGTVSLRLVNPTTVTLGAATLTVRATAMGFT